jgi:hypothetical protein
MNPPGSSASRLAALAFSLLLVASCAGPSATAGLIQVEVAIDDEVQTVLAPPGSTVQQVLEAIGFEAGQFDRIAPPAYTVLSDGARVDVERVVERFEVETVTLPFEHQTIRNEALPQGETRLLQPGENGLQEITYRIIEENGGEVSRTPIQAVVVQPAVPEITMVGAQLTLSVISIDGTLAYLSGGNAWIIRDNSANRRPVIVSGDLDGRIFRLSRNGEWLLFTRAAADPSEGINALWAISTIRSDAEPIDLEAANVVHFADWAPSVPPLTVAYSTVEPSPAAPGWQANNDLWTVTFNSGGDVLRQRTLIAPNAGGLYGWWGTTFAWAGETLMAYARADSIGLVDLTDPRFDPLVEITPLQTIGDWAWVPGISWGPDDYALYLVNHAPPIGPESPTASQAFDVIAVPRAGGAPLPLASRTGMFANPVASPAEPLPGGEVTFQVAYLQALTPLQSAESTYRLVVMDRDGSNQRLLFPAPGEPGMRPQAVAWAPDGAQIAVEYRGSLWVIEVATGLAQPLTGDGQVVAVSWR